MNIWLARSALFKQNTCSFSSLIYNTEKTIQIDRGLCMLKYSHNCWDQQIQVDCLSKYTGLIYVWSQIFQICHSLFFKCRVRTQIDIFFFTFCFNCFVAWQNVCLIQHFICVFSTQKKANRATFWKEIHLCIMACDWEQLFCFYSPVDLWPRYVNKNIKTDITLKWIF